MELDPNDYDVVKLLTKLKKAEDQYPSDLLESRRQGYVRRVAEIGVGMGVSAGMKNSLNAGSKAGGGSTAATAIGGIVEAILVLAIVAEASAAAFIYRDQIKEVIQSYASNYGGQEVASPIPNGAPLIEPVMTELPAASDTPETTPTTLATLTPAAEEGNQAISTPDPNGNNGNHFGQTPQAGRTKKPDGNNKDNDGGNGKGNNK